MKSITTFRVPIFEVEVMIAIADDARSVKRQIDKFTHGEPDLSTGDEQAFCQFSGNCFALFYEREALKRKDIVAHEIFHLTHRILEFREANFDPEHHEMAAMLNGWLTAKIARVLRK